MTDEESSSDSTIVESLLQYLKQTHSIDGNKALDILERAKRRQGELLNIHQAKLTSSGSFEEILVCNYLSLKWNRQTKQGADATDPLTNKWIEIKSSTLCMAPGNKMNASIMYELPPRTRARSGSSRESYIQDTLKPHYARFDKHIWAILKDGADTAVLKHWEFDGKFAVELIAAMAKKNTAASALNFGGKYCKKCKSVHRIDYFKQIEQHYKEKDASWWTSAVNKRISEAICIITETVLPKTLQAISLPTQEEEKEE